MNPLDARESRHTRAIAALHERSARLASVYQFAFEGVRTPAPEGGEAVRVSVICHCMREVMTGLPSVLSDEAIPRPEPSSDSLLSKLPELMAKHSEVDLAADQDVIPLPRAVAGEFDALVRTRIQENGRNRRNAAALITGGVDATSHPAIKQWTSVYRFFVSWAHLDQLGEQGRELPTDEALLDAMDVVADVIQVRTTEFFNNLHLVEDMLAEINAEVEGGA